MNNRAEKSGSDDGLIGFEKWLLCFGVNLSSFLPFWLINSNANVLLA